MARIILTFEDVGTNIEFKVEGTDVHEQPETGAEKLAFIAINAAQEFIESITDNEPRH